MVRAPGTFWVAVFYLLSTILPFPSTAWASSLTPGAIAPEIILNADHKPEIRELLKLHQSLGLPLAENAKFERGKDAVAFTSEIASKKVPGTIPEKVPGTFLKVRTLFDTAASTVKKRVMKKQGSNSAAFDVTLESDEKFAQAVYSDKRVGEVQAYESADDVITYFQSADKDGNVNLKEWIYARSANSPEGSRYEWKYESAESGGAISLEKNKDGTVSIYRNMVVGGVDAKEPQKQQHAKDVVRKLFSGKAHLKDHELIGTMNPLIYWTANGLKKQAAFEIASSGNLIISIQEPRESYPLKIDPTLAFGQWLGADEGTAATIKAMTVNTATEEIYVAGESSYGVFNETVTFQGTHSGSTEGFVVEIADGTTPALNWGQWLGGAGADQVTALVIDGDEIYAGGNSSDSTSWESVTFQGAHSGGNEGFVVEIADGTTPALNWGQWLGGSSTDQLFALTVNGDEIYAGGYSDSTTSWESVTFQGAHSGGNEGFVVEIADGTTPTLNWGQWLGGTSNDQVLSLGMDGDEIYAGGYSQSTTSWESVTFQGTHSGGREGFVVEIADGTTPTLNWGQWLGGSTNENVTALAVNGDEIYAGGDTSSTTSWESVTFQGTHSGSFEVFVVEIADGATPTLNWGQWLGGSSTDQLYALTVNGDEIYAGGYSSSTTSWESVTFQGTHSGGMEGFVVEIADGATPALNWGQWLGGTSVDQVFALTVNGDEIYVGGYSLDTTSWESVTFQGTYGGTNSEGFVVEIADGATPTLNWGQWLGGSGTDQVTTLAVNGDEIYVGGYSLDTTSWESVTFQGTHSGHYEGFLVEIADGTTPTLNWGQWLGGTEADQVLALTVNGDEIYAGGYSSDSTSWESVTFQGTHSGSTEGFVVEIADGTTPTLNWGQWLGGTSSDSVTALVIDGDEIYAGGYSSSTTSWESVTFQGTHSGSTEGFVVEIADGTTPTLNWGQWLGGTEADQVYTLAVNGDEIYAGGYSTSSTSWESVTFQGTHSAATEGFVVEIADGTTPTLNWGQWLGGASSNSVRALVVSGDEIYAGGNSIDSTSWESVTFQGTHSGSTEGFVVEIADGTTPTLNWGQWLGGTSNDAVDALAVNGDEIYAGGYSTSSTSWESVTFQGTHSGSTEGFVVEIADGATPTLNWGQWLGGTGTDQVSALAVTNNEIYAGGYSSSSTSWESATFQGAFTMSDSEGFLVEIKDAISVSGTAYANDETTPLTGSAYNGASRVNGGSTAGTDFFTTTTNSADGTFTFSDVPSAAGDTFTIYFYGASDGAAGTYTGNVVTITDGSTDIIGVKLIDDHVVIRSDNGSTATTIVDMVDYDNDNNSANLLFTAADATPDTLSVEAGNELYITASELFTPGGNVTASGGMDIRGTYTATGTESITIGFGNWNTDAAGTFVAASSTVTFTPGTNATTVTTGGADANHDFNNVVIDIANASNNFNVTTNDMDINGNLTFSGGLFNPTTNVYLAGNLVIDDATAVGVEVGTGDLIFDGAGLQTITNSVGETAAVAEVQISNTSASGVRMDNAVSFQDFVMNANAKFDCNGYDLTIGGGVTTWTVASNATFITGANTVTFYASAEAITVTTGGTDDSHDFNNVVIAISNAFNDFNVATNDMDIDGNLTLSGGSFSPTTNVYLAGNLLIDDATNVAAENDSGDLIFDGTGLQTVTNSIGETDAIAEVQISNTAGVRLDHALTVTSTAVNSSALLNLNGKNYTSATAFTNSGTLQLTGDETVTTPTNNAGSTVEYTATSSTRAIKGWTYQSLKINGSGGAFTVPAALAAIGENLTVSAGTFDANDQTLAINGNTVINGGSMKTGTAAVTFGNAAGDSVTISGTSTLEIESDNTATDIVKNAGTWTNTAGTIKYNAATGIASSLLSALSPYNHLTVDSTGSTYSLSAGITVNGNLLISNGTLDVNSSTGYDINLGGNWTNNGSFTPRAKTVTFNGSGTQTLISGGTSSGKQFYTLARSGSGTLNISTNDVYAGGDVTVSGGTLATKGYELTATGALTVSSGTLDATDSGGEGDTSRIYAGGNVNFTGGGFTAANSTLIQNGIGSTTLTSAGQSLNNFIVNDGLVGYWKMDETAANSCTGGANDSCDSSGYGNDGAWQADATASSTVPTLHFNDPRSVTFDGTGDYVLLSSSADGTILDAGGKDEWSLAAWVYVGSCSAQSVIGGWWDDNSTSYEYLLYINSSCQPAAAFLSSTSDYMIPTGTAISTSTWYHIAGTFKRNTGDGAKLYVNGVQVNSVPAWNDPLNNSADTGVAIGANFTAYPTIGSPFNGKIDEFRIYNRTLTAAEVAALASGTHPATAASGSKVTLEDTLDVNGSLVINSGDLDNKAAEDNLINVAGSWWNNGGKFTNDGGTVTIDGGSGTNSIQAGNEDFYNLTVAGGGGTWNLVQDVMVTSTMSHSAGTVGTNGYDLVLTGNLTAAASLDLSTGTHSVMGAVNLTGATLTAGTSNLVMNPSGTQNLTEANKILNNFVITSKDGLVGWWKLDETAANSCTGGSNDACDSSSSANDGAWNDNATAATAVTPVNFSNPRSVYFDGTGDYVSIGDPGSGALDFGTGSFSYGLWVYVISNVSSWDMPWYKGGASAANPGYDMELGSSYWTANLHDGTDFAAADFSATPLLGQWAHLMVVVDRSTQKMYTYLNGALTNSPGESISSIDSLSNSISATIGASASVTNPFNGYIDDVRVYNRALTAAEVAALARGHSLSATGTAALQDTMDVNGHMILGDGTFDAGANTIKVAKNWINDSATFTYGTSIVDFDDDAQNNSIYGNTTFYHLKIDSAVAKTVSFESAKTQTIAANGALTFTGASGQLLTLAPMTAATDWNLSVNATGVTQSISYATVTYSDASGGTEINAADGTNTDGAPGETNTNWNFAGDTSGAFLTFF